MPVQDPAASPLIAAIAARLAASGGADVPVMLIGFRGLPRINDSGGQGRGDHVLATLRERIAAMIPAAWKGDVVIERLHGPRFALLPPAGVPSADLASLLRDFHAVLARPLADDPGGRMAARILVLALDASASVDAGLRAAMPLLQRPGATHEAAELSHALRAGEIAVLFQPQFDADDRLCGMEALARWHHPRKGVLGADALVRTATVAAMQPDVGAAVQARALAMLAALPDALAGLTLALNITATDLADPACAERFVARVIAAGVAPSRIVAEVTEAAMLASGPQVRANLLALRQAGVRIAADDFGTGYSALAWLKDLPLDLIKLDRVLIADIADDPRALAVVRAVTDLGRALDLSVLAEGVETQAQRDAAIAAGCARWQGFLGAPPITLADIVSRWRAGDWRI